MGKCSATHCCNARSNALKKQKARDAAAAKAELAKRRPELNDIVQKVRSSNLTYLTEGALTDLALFALRIDDAGLEGSIVEAGTALGGSAAVSPAPTGNAKPPLSALKPSWPKRASES